MKIELFDSIKELQRSYESLMDEIATALSLRKGIDIDKNGFLIPEIIPSGCSIDFSSFPDDFAEKMKEIGSHLGGNVEKATDRFSEYVKSIRSLGMQNYENETRMISFIQELNATMSNVMKGIVHALPEKTVDVDENGNLFII